MCRNHCRNHDDASSVFGTSLFWHSDHVSSMCERFRSYRIHILLDWIMIKLRNRGCDWCGEYAVYCRSPSGIDLNGMFVSLFLTLNIYGSPQTIPKIFVSFVFPFEWKWHPLWSHESMDTESLPLILRIPFELNPNPCGWAQNKYHRINTAVFSCRLSRLPTQPISYDGQYWNPRNLNS